MVEAERATRCIIAYAVAYDREPERLQALLDTVSQAAQYYSDQLAAYTNLVYYLGHHEALPNKRQTYSLEGDNAELRHYLTRLGRHSRYFTHSLAALKDAVKLFVYAWNHRQLFRWAHPLYPTHVFQFICPRLWPLPVFLIRRVAIHQQRQAVQRLIQVRDVLALLASVTGTMASRQPALATA